MDLLGKQCHSYSDLLSPCILLTPSASSLNLSLLSIIDTVIWVPSPALLKALGKREIVYYFPCDVRSYFLMQRQKLRELADTGTKA